MKTKVNKYTINFEILKILFLNIRKSSKNLKHLKSNTLK